MIIFTVFSQRGQPNVRTNRDIEEFEEDTFWDELVERLSERDLVEEYGEECVLEMDVHTRLEKLDESRAKYLEEFEKNGLQNVKVF